ncbi:T9SS type B sorting domain-containing protein [Salmonirosea aquatica]|uniref:T9SS type B sorting domain-containing protein n=1 Tax=Salmonirosea aquatica TaxID=2654236 RepID=A0A7C9BPQ8_9BACT|nr:T9SS type B sorting domain-containing protein [Cytophagaceae bacterium SJW1-29]
MKKNYKGFWLILLGILACGTPLRASHILGGNLVLTPKDNLKGTFTVYVVLYYDAQSTDPNAEQTELTVSFFRKRDNVRLNDLGLKLVSREPLAFTNPGCAASRNLKINVVKFAADIQLPLSQYGDPQGYYITWERCCRSSTVGNIQSAGTSALVLYGEFPPVSTQNSSPVFSPANGEVLCRDKPYTFASGATDPDGDELRYRLETPFTSTRPPYGIDPLAPATAGPYPQIEWGNGFSMTNPLPSSPAFTLDSKTGTISLTPSKTGLFVYRVVVEEYRNGHKVGEVHRDYQMVVVDCSNENPPPVALTEADFPPGTSVAEGDSLIEVGICRGDTIRLKAEVDSRWAYQWQRDGVNLEQAKGAAITITQEGVYSVVKTFADRCANTSTLSEKFGVKYRTQAQVEITPGPEAGVCEGSSLDLKANVGGPGWSFRWEKDGTDLDGASLGTLSGVREAGVYLVKATDVVTRCVSRDTVVVTLNALPPAQLSIPAVTQLCQGDSVQLQANQGSNLTYAWYRDDVVQPDSLRSSRFVRNAGIYSVQVKDTTTGCFRRSDTLRIVVNPLPEVLFDSIPLVCGQANTRLALVATPAGGTFSGRGVEGTTFDARQAGGGSHIITYNYQAPTGCSATATRTAQVLPAPRALLGSGKTILQGDSLLLRSSVTEEASYAWSPPLGLNDPTLAQPIASPEQTTTYLLRVTAANGCFSESEIRIVVLPPVKIPNGFTPNGDGTNDTWEIENSSAYTDCEVTVFNRWGNTVYASKGYHNDWDGRINNEELPNATYYYVIKLHPELPVKSGSVTIFR